NGRANLDYNTQKTQDFKEVNDALNGNSMSIVWRIPSGAEFSASMNSTSYSYDPILSDKVLTAGGNKVGYLAFSSFVNITDRQGLPTDMYNRFEAIFNNFQTEGIRSLIVDLRYNGGGAVNTAEYLVNKIAPASAHGKQMYYYKLNTLLTRDWKWTQADSAFAPVAITKLGTLDLDKVYFLVSRNTASASELLINTLKPYLNIQTIGPERTYGKPVGYFPVEIGLREEEEVYVTSFQMFNAQGYGDYFNGLDLSKQAYEDYFKDFGDPEEALLAHALYHLSNGKYSTGALNKSASILPGERQKTERLKEVKIIGPLRAGDYGMFKFK
ncbi:MAG TPA: S41 family peptidase, partial [Sphingobacterium sp.]|nr:S41 family peptidase [Sphingobacterium sp.]